MICKSAIDCLSAPITNLIALEVQRVLLDGFLAERLKSSEADMESNFNDLDTVGSDLVENLRREMQSSSWGSCRALIARKYSLIALPIGGPVFTTDVRRKGYVAQAFESREEVHDWMKAQSPLAILASLDDLGFQQG